ncbi:MAG: hypothetical protein ACYC7E_08285 [Armatimonadota bacterium]
MTQTRQLPRVHVGLHNGRPMLFWNGEPFFYTAYWIRHVVDKSPEGGNLILTDREEYVRRLADLCRPFAQRGIHCYEVPVNLGWNGPDAWDFVHPKVYGEPVDDQFRAVLAADPQGRVMVNFCLHPPQTWCEAYPDELELDADGNRHEVSIGSDRYLNELLAHLPDFIRYVEEGPYAEHVLTYFFSYGYEGFTESSLTNGVSDFSPAMHNAFRRWLKVKYAGSVEALRTAWKDPDVTFDTAGVPTRDEQLFADDYWFRDPTGPRKVFDYMECRVDCYVDIHYRIAHAIKEACNYRLPVYCFGAYLAVTGWPGALSNPKGMAEREYSPHALSVQTGWRRIIECPDIDGWESPFDYFYRQMGGVCINQSLEESMKLRGKAFQVNEDQRGYLAAIAGDVYGTVDTKEETTAVYRRNFGAIASHWCGCNWMEQIRNWLQDDFILDQLGEFHRLLQHSLEWPETPVDAIGVFIDEESIRYEKPLIDLDWELICKQRFLGLSHCGVPFRMHLLDDLALENMPDYKCNIFLNTFYMNQEREALLKKAMQRDGKTAVWMIAPGYCHATEGLSLASMERLTGMQFARIDAAWDSWTTITDFTHPITRNLPEDLIYGASARIGPVLKVDDPQATVLGKRLLMMGMHEPTFAVKEFGTHRSIFSGAPQFPGSLLREIARYAGCHVYIERNDVVTAGRGLITYHTASTGPRTVRLPAPATVYDLFTGELLGENTDAVTLPFEQPGTVVMTTLPPEMWRK